MIFLSGDRRKTIPTPSCEAGRSLVRRRDKDVVNRAGRENGVPDVADGVVQFVDSVVDLAGPAVLADPLRAAWRSRAPVK
jgi:hypothetical protein